MAKFNPVHPFESLHGKYATGDRLSFRETMGVKHTYILQHPYEGPASPAQSAMRQAMGTATKYASIILRDPATKAEWQARCAGTTYRRADRYCIAEHYRLFKSDPDQLAAAQAVVEQDRQRKLQEETARNIAKAQAEEQSANLNLSETELLQRQIQLLSARIADLESRLQPARQ